MSEETRRILLLEQQNREQSRALQQLKDGLLRLEGQLALAQGAGGGGGGGAGVYYIHPAVIAAGGSLASQTVYFLSGGTETTFTASATIRNIMAQATVATAGLNIIVLPNGDGSYLAVTQSCP